MGLKGREDSRCGLKGKINGFDEIRGYSAYEVALINGFDGTEEEWLASLKGPPGQYALVTVTSNGDGTYTSDKTYKELLEEKKAGKTLHCRYYDDDVYLPFVSGRVLTFCAVFDCYIYQVEIIAAGEGTQVNLKKIDISTLNSGGGSSSRIAYVNLLASAWSGTESPYSQVVQISGATENSQVDLNPSVEQLAIFHDKDLAFVTENEDGVVTVYALGDKPTNDYKMQVTITEVYV